MNYIFSPNTQFLAVSSGHIGPHIPYELTDIPAGTRMFHGEATQPLIFVVAPRRGSKVVFLRTKESRADSTSRPQHKPQHQSLAKSTQVSGFQSKLI
jgi:hypothetical protein